MDDRPGNPRSIPYNPSLRGIAAFCALGIGIGVVNALSWIQSPLFGVGAGSLIAISAILMLRRSRWGRSLVVTENAMMVPSGFLRLRPRPIRFASIQRVWVTRILWTDILRVRTTEGDVEIQDMYLPEPKMLCELKEFLESFAVGGDR
jgi:uncharacterized membrane protein (UPF0136 family)